MVAPWPRQLVTDPEQPALFFLRGGRWRWWSHATFAAAVATVARAAEAESLGARVEYSAPWPHEALAVDLGLRRAGRESVPWWTSASASVAWRFPALDELEPGVSGTLGPPGEGVGFALWRGQAVGLDAFLLAKAARRLGEEVDPLLASVAGRPIVLTAGSIDAIEVRVWCAWAAQRGAILLLVRDPADLAWATTWSRPHLVLGRGDLMAAAVDYHADQGPGRRPSWFGRRFERLRGWVEVESSEAELAGAVGLGATWTELGVEWRSFPDLSSLLP